VGPFLVNDSVAKAATLITSTVTSIGNSIDTAVKGFGSERACSS
jgi:hypothetical protein